MLAEYRFLNFMEDISRERIEKIFKKYQKPKNFIERESKTCRKCLELIFQAGLTHTLQM